MEISKSTAVVCFFYNRPQFASSLLKSLNDCVGMKEFKYFFFLDASRKISDKTLVEQSKVVIKQWLLENPSKGILIERQENFGLQKSIRSGIDFVISKGFDQFIVLEDDLIVKKYGLLYLNGMLDRYSESPSIGSISGYSYPLFTSSVNGDIYNVPRFCSWGWASWATRWKQIEWFKSGESFEISLVVKSLKGGIDLPVMYFKQMRSDSFDSWAIQYQMTAIKKGWVHIYPALSLIENQGWKFGVHARGDERHYEIVTNDLNQGVYFKNFALLRLHLYLIKFYIFSKANRIIRVLKNERS